MADHPHVIGDLRLELQFTSQQSALSQQGDITNFIKSEIVRRAGQVFDEFGYVNQTIRLDRIEIDLGSVSREMMRPEISKRFSDRLRDAVKGSIEGQHAQSGPNVHAIPADHALFQQLQHFLTHGHLPWQSVLPNRGEFDALLLQVLESHIDELVHYLRLSKTEATDRLILQLPRSGRSKLLQALIPGDRAQIVALEGAVSELLDLASTPTVTERRLWAAVARHVLNAPTGSMTFRDTTAIVRDVMIRKGMDPLAIDSPALNPDGARAIKYRGPQSSSRAPRPGADTRPTGTGTEDLLKGVKDRSEGLAPDSLDATYGPLPDSETARVATGDHATRADRFSTTALHSELFELITCGSANDLTRYWTHVASALRPEITAALRFALRRSRYRGAVVSALDDSRLAGLVAMIQPGAEKWVAAMRTELQQLWVESGALNVNERTVNAQLWFESLSCLVNDRLALCDETTFVESLLRPLSEKHGLEYAAFLETSILALSQRETLHDAQHTLLRMLRDLHRKECNAKIAPALAKIPRLAATLDSLDTLRDFAAGKSIGLDGIEIHALLERLLTHQPAYFRHLARELHSDFHMDDMQLTGEWMTRALYRSVAIREERTKTTVGPGETPQVPLESDVDQKSANHSRSADGFDTKEAGANLFRGPNSPASDAGSHAVPSMVFSKPQTKPGGDSSHAAKATLVSGTNTAVAHALRALRGFLWCNPEHTRSLLLTEIPVKGTDSDALTRYLEELDVFLTALNVSTSLSDTALVTLVEAVANASGHSPGFWLKKFVAMADRRISWVDWSEQSTAAVQLQETISSTRHDRAGAFHSSLIDRLGKWVRSADTNFAVNGDTESTRESASTSSTSSTLIRALGEIRQFIHRWPERARELFDLAVPLQPAATGTAKTTRDALESFVSAISVETPVATNRLIALVDELASASGWSAAYWQRKFIAFARQLGHGMGSDKDLPAGTRVHADPFSEGKDSNEAHYHELLARFERSIRSADSETVRAATSEVRRLFEDDQNTLFLVNSLSTRSLAHALAKLFARDYAQIRYLTEVIGATALFRGSYLTSQALHRRIWFALFDWLIGQGQPFAGETLAQHVCEAVIDVLRVEDVEEFKSRLGAQLPRDVYAHRWLPELGQNPGRDLEQQASTASPAEREDGSGNTHRSDTQMNEEPAAGSDIFLSNAGIVLLAPYLPRLFAMLELVEENLFIDHAAAERAVHVLQYAVTSDGDTPEPALVLNKLLCGIPPVRPVARELTLTDTERQSVDGLLEAVIEHWGTLRNTSTAGLRSSFLQRDGRLRRADNDWKLLVAGRAFDLLLDSLPWSYTLIRYPWMEGALHVDWR